MSIAVGYNKIDQIYINNTGVNKIYKGEDLVYDRSLQNKFEYFYVYADQPISNESAQAAGTISLKNKGGNTPNIEYSTDGITWTTWDYSALTLYGPVESEESSPIYSYIFFRGYNPNGFSLSSSVWSSFKIIDSLNGEAYIHIGGNIMSLLYKDSFWKEDESPNNTIPNNYCFQYLFRESDIYSCLGMPGLWTDDQQKLHPLNPLRLPATTLSDSCYNNMFLSCYKLTYGPLILPAKTLRTSCYRNMFFGCGSLVTTPKLPATTLDSGCYSQMFHSCSVLEEGPVLPATTLVNRCYEKMFRWCDALQHITILATDISVTNGLENWVDGVSSTGTFVKKKGVTYPTGASGIPEGWTVEEID